jgi:hypothetical protein
VNPWLFLDNHGHSMLSSVMIGYVDTKKCSPDRGLHKIIIGVELVFLLFCFVFLDKVLLDIVRNEFVT